MAKYPDLITTKKGLDLNSAANAAQKAVIFTKVVAGDGDVPSGTSISDLTAVVAPKMTLEITNKENLGNGHFTIRSVLGNENLENGFYAKEIGVYAKLDGDVEVLYAYTNGGNYVDYIPDKSSPIDAQVFNIDVIIGNLQQATILINDETHVTVQDLEEHNTNENAHANLALLINDALAPTADNNTLVNLLSNLANMLTKITGENDWKTGPAASIAAILSNLQGNLAVNWNGNKFTVPALGVSGLMAQNGYINFGKLFGGLIVQWGLCNNDTTRKFNFPISIKPAQTVVSVNAFYAITQVVEINSTYVSWQCYQRTLDAPISSQISVRIIVISY